MDTGDGAPPQRPSADPERSRRAGGGRPTARERQPGLQSACARILETNSAGSPTNPNVVWTHRKPLQLAAALVRRGFEVGRNTAAKLLDAAGYRRRSLRKALITGHVDPQARDRQFRHIDARRQQARAAGNPVLCVDTKKQALLGCRHRSGQCYSTDVQHVYDHDCRHLAAGQLVPHGVDDSFNKRGCMTLGTSRATSAFVCDAIALAWTETFRHAYPQATESVLTCDAGGANAARSLRFNEDLIALRRRLDLPLRIAHYPPDTAKWHPIAHRLFSQVERALRGVMRDSPQTALRAIQRFSTQTGLSVVVRILDRVYDIGRKCSDTFRDIKDQFIRHDAVLREWNYLVDGRGLNPECV